MVRQEKSPSSMAAWEESAVLIAQEIQEWSERVVEQGHPLFGGMPMCPFARKAWTQGHVMVHVTQDIQTVVELKATFPPTSELIHVVAWTGWDEMSPEEFSDWIDHQNRNHFNIWIMGFHPETEADERLPEFDGNGADDYALLLVQSYRHLVAGSDMLRKTRYYENYTPDDLKVLQARQENFYAWDKKVDAKAFAAAEEQALTARISGEEQDH